MFSDLRFALRMLRKNPIVMAEAVLALAIGIGLNTALFSMVNEVLLSPLPFREAERIVSLYSTEPENHIQFSGCSGPDFLDWNKGARSFVALAAMQKDCKLYLAAEYEPLLLRGALVTPGFFKVLSLQPSLGRAFVPEDAESGQQRVVILSYGLWRRRFGGDTNLLGRALSLDGNPYVVVGVMPKQVGFLDQVAEAYLPFPTHRLQDERGSRYFAVWGRLKSGVTLGQARAEMSTLAKGLARDYPATNKGWGVTMLRLHDDLVRSLRLALLVLHGAVGLVLLIASINVANLLLARSASRGREMSVRLALGASRAWLVRQLLSESVLLAVIGGACGLLFANWASAFILAVLPPTAATGLGLPPKISLDLRVLGFTLLLSLLTGVLFGLAPALYSSKPDLAESLKAGGRGGAAGPGSQRMFNWLVVTETAMSLALLATAGLLTRGYMHLQRIDPGFDPANVLTVELELPHHLYRDSEGKRVSFFKDVVERVGFLPGVETAAAIHLLPMGGQGFSTTLEIEGAPSSRSGRWKAAEHRVIHPAYFRTMRVPLVGGRAFGAQDHAEASPVVIINQALARRYFGSVNPLGKRIRVGDTEQLEIVGVVVDEKCWGLGAEPPPMIYRPCLQECWCHMSLVVRTKVPPLSLAPAVRQAVGSVAPTQPIGRITTMQQLVDDSVSVQRFTMVLLGLFAGVALVLATIGIYGVMSFAVSQRTREIGVRMALGASATQVWSMVMKQGLRLAGLGLVIGLLAALAAGRLVEHLIPGMHPADPLTLNLVSLLLLAVSLAACYVPARRAAHVDPMVALRCE